MKKQLCFMFSLCLVFFFLSLIPANAVAKGSYGIRTVDFLNLRYPSTLCHKEYGSDGLNENVQLNNGEFKLQCGNDENDFVYFGIVNNKVLYSDLTRDGREEAVVHIGCGISMSNYGLNEIFIYTYNKGKESLLAHISDRDMERDYKKYYKSANDSLWSAIEAIRVNNGTLQIEKYSEGPHCCPEHVTTLTYKLNRTSLVLIKKPERRKFTSK